MIKNPDESLSRFIDLTNNEWKDLSESDTRCKLIDPLFLDCLNWDENDIIREENVKQAGYIDYIFKIGERPLFLLEAKKEGVTFEIPPNFKDRHYKISGTISECKDLIKAMEQVHGYCAEIGVKIAVVSNGYQYVIFEALKIGTSWRDGKCLIFNGLNDIKLSFGTFFKYLNKNSVSNGSLHKLLSDKTDTFTFIRPLDKIPNRDSTLNRNYLHPLLTPFINFIFTDITNFNQLDVLRNCYVYDKAYQATDEGIKQLFIDRVPYYAKEDHIKWFKEGENSAGWFEDKCLDLVRKKGQKGALVLLLGGIGSGKTTFIHRFYNIILEKLLSNMWFYVDFKTAPTSKDKLEEYIYEKIILNFERKYFDNVKKEFETFGIKWDRKSKEEYVSHLLAILRCMGYSVSIVLDNVDRCSVELQEDIFLNSEHLADKFSILILLALREESYYRSKLTGVFDAYHIQKFHISSPHFEKVILSRISYLLNILNKEDKEIGDILGKDISFEDKKEEVMEFFKIIGNSLKSTSKDYRQPITHFITCISEGNMRIALEMFSNFLSSGNTKVEEMMEVAHRGESYFIAEYQFLKSVILNNSRYYRGNNSFIMNVFDLNTDYTTSPFLHLRILNYAFINRSNESSLGRGYIEINRLLQEAEDLFIPKEAVIDSLLKLAKFDLITFDNQSKQDIGTATYFKITSTGGYYLVILVKKFIYLDLIHIDTPISDINTVNELRRKIDTTLLDEKFMRTIKFLEYLNDKEEIEFAENPEYLNSLLTNRQFMKWIINEFQYEMAKILNKPKNKFMLSSIEEDTDYSNIED